MYDCTQRELNAQRQKRRHRYAKRSSRNQYGGLLSPTAPPAPAPVPTMATVFAPPSAVFLPKAPLLAPPCDVCGRIPASRLPTLNFSPGADRPPSLHAEKALLPALA